MEFISASEISALAQVIIVDLVLAGDNAIVVGLVAAGFPKQQRTRVILIGIGAATVMRVVFSVLTIQLLQIIGLMFAGGLLLLWVCWKLWRDIRESNAETSTDSGAEASPEGSDGPPTKTFRKAVVQIVVADVSMSLDNVLAVAGIAREHLWVLVFGLVFSVAIMGLAATVIARLLTRYPWISYVGLVLILYVAASMIWDGSLELLEVSAALRG